MISSSTLRSSNDLKGGIQLKLSPARPPEDDQCLAASRCRSNVLDLNGQPTGTTTLGEDVRHFQRGILQRRPLDERAAEAHRPQRLRRQRVQRLAQRTRSSRPPARRVSTSSSGAPRTKSFRSRASSTHGASRSCARSRCPASAAATSIDSTRVEGGERRQVRFPGRTGATRTPPSTTRGSPFHIHPGTVKGLFNVQNIRDRMGRGARYGAWISPVLRRRRRRARRPKSGRRGSPEFDLQPVYFDADVELENVVQGSPAGGNRKVPAGKKILGFVQLAPRGIPLTPPRSRNCWCASSVRSAGRSPAHGYRQERPEAARQPHRRQRLGRRRRADPGLRRRGRGHVVLPKDGSWSLVIARARHGDVTPLPERASRCPLIRVGRTCRSDVDSARYERCCASPIPPTCCAHPPPTPSISASCRAPTPRRRCS